MLSFLLSLGLLTALTTASPYPPEVAVKSSTQRENPHFPNPIHANITDIPTKTTSNNRLASVGQWVSGGAARWDQNIYDGVGRGVDQYTMYWGDGGAGHGWPSKDRWMSFVDMFNANKDFMFNSCEWNGWGQNNDGPEIGAIWDSIEQVAAETGVDHRFILAIMMQESKGCVRIITTDNGVRNPGLMQCHNGDGTCHSDITGQVQYPCPSGVITQMIREGTAGTVHGDGLAGVINQATSWWGPTDSRAFYMAARLYNSGSIDSSMNLELGIATHCYSSDIANRLTGWVWADHGCWLDG